MKAFLLALALSCAALAPAVAVQPDEMLADKALEARAREIGRELRCLVCQNQSIDDSEAELARDLRILVRERLQRGDSDAQVLDYVHDRYGDFVLLKPPLRAGTLALWIGPGAILLVAGLGLVVWYRRRAATPVAAPVPLSAAEQKRLKALLDKTR